MTPSSTGVLVAHAVTLSGFSQQGLANTVWAVAVLEICDVKFLETFVPQVVQRAQKFNPQEIANVAWAFATLRVVDAEAFGAVSNAGLKLLPELKEVDMANIAWSFATVALEDQIVEAILQMSKERLRASPRRSGVVNVLGLVEAFHTAGKLEESFVKTALDALLIQADENDEASKAESPEPPAKLLTTYSQLRRFCISEPRVLAWRPELYALWKPPGWDTSVHSRLEKRSTLRSWLQDNFRQYPIVHDESVSCGLVHRLDFNTSGVLLWAPCYRGLYEARLQFAARKVCKEYMCLVEGAWDSGPPFFIQEPIATRSMFGSSRSFTSPTGRFALTEVVDFVTLLDPQEKLLSLMKVRLHTGRTHQIRCHMSHKGHPLVGDNVYGGMTPSWCGRQWLHASALSLQMQSGTLELQVPVAEDLRKALRRLRPTDVINALRLREWMPP